MRFSTAALILLGSIVASALSFDQGWKRGWDAHVEAEMQEASRAYQLAPDTLKADVVAPDTIQFADGGRGIMWKQDGDTWRSIRPGETWDSVEFVPAKLAQKAAR